MDGLEAAYLVAGFIALTETQSVFENIEEVTGTDIWSEVKGRMKFPEKK